MGALDGITVLDLTRLLPEAPRVRRCRPKARPSSKIEEPGVGDYARNMPAID